MELSNLVGKHVLSGIERGVKTVNTKQKKFGTGGQTMTQKERLVELLVWNELRDTPEGAESELQQRADFLEPWAEKCADYLLNNGVIVPPCKVGDEVFWNNGMYVEVYKVKGFIVDSENMFRLDLGCFEPIFPHQEGRLAFTRQEAEQALKERKQ